MKIGPVIEDLEKTKEFLAFKSKYPNSFLAAGFFVIDLESSSNVSQIDYYMPNEKKIAAFTLGSEIKLQILDLLNEQIPEKLKASASVDLDALKGILLDEMRNRGMTEDIKKIIAVVQTIDGKMLWNLNCVLTGMEILKSHVEDESQTVLKIEKRSLMEIMQKFPAQKLAQKPAAASKEDLEKEIQNLSKLEEEIEAEKQKLKLDLQGKKTSP